MSDIRYICISDMHLGEECSLLTHRQDGDDGLKADVKGTSPVMRQLIECIRELVDCNQDGAKPTLILNGDCLEMATAHDHEAANVFQRFIELAYPEGNELFDRTIYYLPGNHDHHLWESARETRYLDIIDDVPHGELLGEVWHSTKMFVKEREPGKPHETDPLLKSVPLNFPERIMRRYPHLSGKEPGEDENCTPQERRLRGGRVLAAYPSFGLVTPDRRRCVVFHHGHFAESLYCLISQLRLMIAGEFDAKQPWKKMPEKIYELEEENYAWIDFLWSTLLRSGRAGEEIESIYKKLRDGDSLGTEIANFSSCLAKMVDLPGIDINAIEAGAYRKIFQKLIEMAQRTERSTADQPLREANERWLKQYFLPVALSNQIYHELNRVPDDMTVVMAHTHKPMESVYEGIPDHPAPIRFFNSGGWMLEHIDHEESAKYGGSIILIDEQLNTIALRMYWEASMNEVKLRPAALEGEPRSAFHQELERRLADIEKTNQAFSRYKATVEKEVAARRRLMKAAKEETTKPVKR